MLRPVSLLHTSRRGTRHLHLQQHLALDLVARAGIPVLPYQVVREANTVLEERLWNGGRGVWVRPQVMDSAGLEGIKGGKVGELEGLRFTAQRWGTAFNEQRMSS
jgi:hypothetical protein